VTNLKKVCRDTIRREIVPFVAFADTLLAEIIPSVSLASLLLKDSNHLLTMSTVYPDHLQAEHNFNFSSVQNYDDLPFYINLSPFWKTVTVVSLLITLIEGARLRAIIILYIKSPETKLGPINYLICLEQLNGLFLALLIFMRIIFILSPIPISQILGSTICHLTEFIGVLVLGGNFYWSCCIAVFRVLFVKAQNWLKYKMGVKKLLTIMVGFGICQILVFAALAIKFDNDSSIRKSCFHQSKLLDRIESDQYVSG
jgi:hypothetical protein